MWVAVFKCKILFIILIVSSLQYWLHRVVILVHEVVADFLFARPPAGPVARDVCVTGSWRVCWRTGMWGQQVLLIARNFFYVPWEERGRGGGGLGWGAADRLIWLLLFNAEGSERDTRLYSLLSSVSRNNRQDILNDFLKKIWEKNWSDPDGK